MSRENYKNQKAFTLIELLVVISIIGLISSIVLVSVKSARDRARISAGLQFAASVHHALGDEAVGVWDFDEPAGATSFRDYSGYNNNGSCSGASCPTAGITNTPSGKGFSLGFNGSNYVNVPHSNSLNITRDITVAVWIYKTTNHTGVLVTKRNGTQNYQFSIMTNNTIQLCSTTSCMYSNSVLTNNEWQHIVATRSINSINTINFYRNGAFAGTATATGLPSTNTNNLSIGSRNGVDTFFVGFLDDVRIYANALTKAQVEALYAEGLEKYNLAQSP